MRETPIGPGAARRQPAPISHPYHRRAQSPASAASRICSEIKTSVITPYNSPAPAKRIRVDLRVEGEEAIDPIHHVIRSCRA